MTDIINEGGNPQYKYFYPSPEPSECWRLFMFIHKQLLI